MIDFKDITLNDAVIFQPQVTLKKGKKYPFIEMATVNGISKIIKAPCLKQFDGNGGAKFAANDILFARIEPCLDNKKI
jgi:type I restriction enzyme S subunit